jgi:multidrug efflux pump subunit AcrB
VIFTPYLGVKMLPEIKPIDGGHAAIYGTPNYQRLRRLITFAVRHKFVTCSIVGIAFALSGAGMGALKQQFFPTSDRPEVLVEVRLPEGTSIETTTATVGKIDDKVGGKLKEIIATFKQKMGYGAK